MKKVIVDCQELLHKDQAHSYLAEVLEFPDYYGKNLDALFDCMTELGECTIMLKGEHLLHQADSYGIKVLQVFEEATQANPRLKLEVQGKEIESAITRETNPMLDD